MITTISPAATIRTALHMQSAFGQRSLKNEVKVPPLAICRPSSPLSSFLALLSLTGMNKDVCPSLTQDALTYIYGSSSWSVRSAKF